MIRRLRQMRIGITLVLLFSGVFGLQGTIFAHEHGTHKMSVDMLGMSGETLNGQLSITNLTSIASILLVSIITLFFLGRIRRNAPYFSIMSGMMAAMTISMMTSLVIGTAMGIILERMFFATVTGVIIGMTIGFLSGKSLSILAALDGMMSGVMGGMMGAMLGVMAVGDHPALTVLFMDLIFAILSITLFHMMKGKA